MLGGWPRPSWHRRPRAAPPPPPAPPARSRPRRRAARAAASAPVARRSARSRFAATSASNRRRSAPTPTSRRARPTPPRRSIRRSKTSTRPSCSPTSTITGAETGDLVITVRENPVINRIVLEGNKRLKNDKILPEIKLAPRQIFTRSARSRRRRPDPRALPPPGPLRRPGRAQDRPARPEPRRRRVRDLRRRPRQGPQDQHHRQQGISATAACARKCTRAQAGGLLGFLKSNDTYDPDRLAADQQKLRAFYLTQGYADFRVVSALAELTPDRRDFVITYVVEEGPRYKFGTVEADSALRDFPSTKIKELRQAQAGQLVQRQGSRGFGHRAQRIRRQPRLRFRRYQPGL